MRTRLTDEVFIETKREKELKNERIAWEKTHPKPWYLTNKK